MRRAVKARLTPRNALPVAGVIFAVGLMASCARQGRQGGGTGDSPVAKVEGSTVWASDVRREAAAEGFIASGEPLASSSPVFHQVLDEIEDERLLADDALRRKLDHAPEARRRLFAARERVLADLALEKAISGAVSPRAVQGLYAAMLDATPPQSVVQLRQIVLPSQSAAQGVRRRLASGASFSAMATEQSQDAATRGSGGELPPFRSDDLSSEYARPLRGARTGEIVGPFKTSAGWVIVKVDSISPAPPPNFQAARGRIIRFLTYDRVKDLVLDLRKQGKVQTLIAPLPNAAGPNAARSNPTGPNAAGANPAAANATRFDLKGEKE